MRSALWLALVVCGCTAAPCPDGDAGAVDAAREDAPDAPRFALGIAPTALNLGDVCEFARAPVSVTNAGSVPTGPITATLSGADASSFTIVDSTCLGTLSVGASCTIAIELGPVDLPRDYVASLDVTAGGSTVSTALRGLVPSDACGFGYIGPSPFSFGDVPVGASATHAFTVTNAGGRAWGALRIALSGLDADQFSIVTAGDGCSRTVLDAGGTCTVEVAFAPTLVGDFTATLSAVAFSGGTWNAVLAGRGL